MGVSYVVTRYFPSGASVLSPVIWLLVAGAGIWGFAEIVSSAEKRLMNFRDWMVVITQSSGLLGLSAVGLWRAYCRTGSARRLLFDKPSLFVSPMNWFRDGCLSSGHSLLSSAKKKRLWEDMTALTDCELLMPNEVDASALIESAYHRDESVFDSSTLLDLLADGGGASHGRFLKLAFFSNGRESDVAQARRVVIEMARLSGYSESLADVKITVNTLVSQRGGFPAIASFEFKDRRVNIPFVMFDKSIPYDLIQQLSTHFAPIRIAGQGHFYAAGSDCTVALMVLSHTQRQRLTETLDTDAISLDKVV